MKKIFTLCAALLAGASSFAQIDVSVTEVNYNLDATGEVLAGSAGPVSIVWENLGDTIKANDTVFVFIQINGVTLTAPGFLAPADYLPGSVDTFNYMASTAQTQTTFQNNLSNLSLLASSGLTIGGTPVGPNREISSFIEVRPVVGSGTDANPANDTGRVSYTLVDGDFASSNIQVIAGDANSSNEIPEGGTLDTLGFTLENASTLPFFHYAILLETEINGTKDTLSLTLPRTADSYGAFTGFMNGGSSLNISGAIDNSLIPTTAGSSFDVCYRAIYGDDSNTANDQVCETYTIVSSVGINDVLASEQHIYVQNTTVVVENVETNQNVVVTNVAGQVVYTGVLEQGRNEISINESTGIYIVKTEEKTEKVVLK